MALLDLWNSDRHQIIGKRIDQLIAFAGEGRLRDSNSTSEEFRALLNVVTSDVLGRWLDECLENRFTDFGFVLQDSCNEVGRRLGFEVMHGVYRGHSNESYDGLWRIPGGRAILVESKASANFSINLSRISEYRKQVAPQFGIKSEDISILIIVGAEETAEFEAQVRGSRFAWDIRLLGVKSLFRLLQLKETLDDPKVEKQIQEILIPQEFTRLDRIIDLVFATAEDAKDSEVEVEDDEEEIESSVEVPKRAPANFHAAIIPQLEMHFGSPLVRRSRSQWATPDDAVLVSCRVSKDFKRGNLDYWFGLKRDSRRTLQDHKNAYCAFGLGTPERVVVLPMSFFDPYVDNFFSTPEADGGVLHWHVRFVNTETGVALLVDRDRRQIDVTPYLLKSSKT